MLKNYSLSLNKKALNSRMINSKPLMAVAVLLQGIGDVLTVAIVGALRV